MPGESNTDPDDDVRIDATGTVHPLSVRASQSLRARAGEWDLLESPPDVVLAMRRGQAPRTLRLAGQVRTPGALYDVVTMIEQGSYGGELVLLEKDTERSIFFERGRVIGATTTATGESLGEILWRFGAITRERRHLERIPKFCRDARVRIAGHGDVIDVGERNPRGLQAILNRKRGKSRSVFYAVEALFLDCGDEFPITNDRGRSVAVVCVDAKDVHSVKAVNTRLSCGLRCTALQSVARYERFSRHHSFRT